MSRDTCSTCENDLTERVEYRTGQCETCLEELRKAGERYEN